jgi:hypothetical protein
MTPLEYARRYLDAGISVIPIARDGTKAPAAGRLPTVWDGATARYRSTWAPYRERRATPLEAEVWWGGLSPSGIAALAGTASGGLELIDFDQPDLWGPWCSLVEEDYPGLLERLCLVQTPRPSWHAWLYCPAEVIPGNTKLATDPTQKTGRTMIETRGEGGYALVPGCPSACHPSGGTYLWAGDLLLWDLRRGPGISPDERAHLLRCARFFDRSQPVQEWNPRASACDLRPGNDYDRRGPGWESILTPHGWVLAGTFGQEARWRRPGKERGWSATTGYCHGKDGADLLRVFSSNAAPFEDGCAYGKFRALALLEHGGDYSACARRLALEGYGSPGPQLRARHNLPPRPSRDEADRVLAVLNEYPDEARAVLQRLGFRLGERQHG